VKPAIVVITTLLLLACGDSTGAGIAVTLNLHSVDGVVLPVQGTTPGGRVATVVGGKLQGTNWGHACGMVLRLAEGPITTGDVSDCKLFPGEERRVTMAVPDSRFPAGQHEYRFVP
jgi:hypothetical protein